MVTKALWREWRSDVAWSGVNDDVMVFEAHCVDGTQLVLVEADDQPVFPMPAEVWVQFVGDVDSDSFT
ncbi:hypothetical protein C500_01695 [Natrialba magadii ATCC 43099]|uniref:DUF397 domain-containing protein n=1 Tax=Natrialba magadii (strain ATCC 43099 / DSM 3394 / CCM 3739 / CIP 104546 / IAM 13178 / JCM 8861 / NBRC 102185 / NCIMB 2190 / MS3) TaxID=547559 RepID=L9V8H1_NATMM|nr:hypothetical protein C500_01695 [Natrialba magadii ATCC 43099]